MRHEVLTGNKENGSGRLVNLAKRDRALKIEWIRKINTLDDPVLNFLAQYHLGLKIKEPVFWECNFCENDVHMFNCKTKFWEDLLKAWAEYNYSTPQTLEEILNQVLWYNSNVKIAGRFVMNEKMYGKGVIYVKDLVRD